MSLIHAVYDPWGKPLSTTNPDVNFAGIDNITNFTGYTWDVTLMLYFAQARFYDASDHRFTQQAPAKDGANWYVNCGNNPVLFQLLIFLNDKTINMEYTDTRSRETRPYDFRFVIFVSAAQTEGVGL